MILVFFFKQKTAYEMRISDWSSDVCSSDLLCIAAEGTRQDADTNACLESGSIVEKRCKESGTGYSSGCCKEIKQFNERGCFCNSEIGRASCRERVCQ